MNTLEKYFETHRELYVTFILGVLFAGSYLIGTLMTILNS